MFAFAKANDIKLVNLAMSDETLRLFPGPAHGAPGVRRMMNLDDDDVVFGTVVKPCTGITPQQQAEIIADAARIRISCSSRRTRTICLGCRSRRLRTGSGALWRSSKRPGIIAAEED